MKAGNGIGQWVISVIILLGCGDDGAGNETDTDSEDTGGGGDSDPADTGTGAFSVDDPLFNEQTATVAEWITPDWYTCETEESACGLPCPADDLWVAINPTDFRSSAVCSACMTVEGPLGRVVVEVIENCGDACADSEIELSRSAFESIALLDDGHATVSWQLVPCARSGSISFAYEKDSDEWWAGIQVREPALPVAGLSIRYGDMDWTALEMDGWNHFPIAGDLGAGPFDFLVTAIDGQELIEEGIPYVPGGVAEGTHQFEVSY